MRESMMRGFKGADVRCRKCGGTIIVLAPETVPGSSQPADRGERTGGHRGPQPPQEIDGTPGGHATPVYTRPAPAAPLAEPEPVPPTKPLPSAPPEKGVTPGSLLDRQVAWQKEGILPLPGAVSSSARYFHPSLPGFFDIALVGLWLVLRGGMGYLVVRFYGSLLVGGP